MLRGRSGASLVGLVAALALCAAIVFLHQQRQRVHRADPIVGVVRDEALAPPQSLLLRADHWWHVHVTAMGEGPRLARENAVLRSQVQTLDAQNRTLLAAQTENDRLRRLLGFERRTTRPLLAAEVVALKPSSQTDTLTLNRGSANGVKAQDTVLSPEGALVGQVLDVTLHSCSVLMLTDTNASVGAEVARPGTVPKSDTPRIGICSGDHTGRLQVTFPRIDADVHPGDQIVTSDLGAVFPQGLPIGVVLTVSTDKTRSVRTAIVRPTADFDHLEEAFLVQ